MCVACLKDQVDITEGISKTGLVLMCKECSKYRAPGGNGAVGTRWLYCENESAELLALCLKSIDGLGKGKKSGATMVDAIWIWTEEHSRRLKIQLTVEKDVFNGAILRQKFNVEFVVKTNLCDSCTKETTDQNWTTIVQVRQQVVHKRTLLNLEQLLLKDKAAIGVMDVRPIASGIDFYFANKVQGLKFSDFVMSVVPARRKESKQLQGSDLQNNKSAFRFNICVEVVPVCRDDCVILPIKLQQSLFGGGTAVAICTKLQNTVTLTNPFTGESANLHESKYWANQFTAVATSREMIEFLVIDVFPLDYSANDATSIREVEVARMGDLESNDERFILISHLGGLMQPGDSVLGYDFANHNINDEKLKPLKGRELPPVILVKKKPVEKANTRKKKNRRKKKTPTVAPDVDKIVDSIENNELLEDDVSE